MAIKAEKNNPIMNARFLIEKWLRYVRPYRDDVPVFVNPTGSEYRELHAGDSHGLEPVRALLDLDQKQVIAWSSMNSDHLPMARLLDLEPRFNRSVIPVFINRGKAELATSFRLQDYRLAVEDLGWTHLDTSQITNHVIDSFFALEATTVPLNKELTPVDRRMFRHLDGKTVSNGRKTVRIDLGDRLRITGI